ncbi:hypothetical protein JTL36_35180, partial [Pseudomonas aeruginosa]|nr:hypothetical protein [Pseudomonas aeruginosa]
CLFVGLAHHAGFLVPDSPAIAGLGRREVRMSENIQSAGVRHSSLPAEISDNPLILLGFMPVIARAGWLSNV